MGKILIVAALESEFFTDKTLNHEIVYSGVGKINAARTITEQILINKPELVVNVGTAGSLKPDLSGSFIVRDVIEHDMSAEPLAPRGSTPFDTTGSVLSSDLGNVRCATGDSFVTEVDPWLVENSVELVDMELFAIAKVCTYYGITWRSLKYVSDYVDENSAESWNISLEKASHEIQSAIRVLLN
jgi:adenosylhomocysteine nucleosidase